MKKLLFMLTFLLALLLCTTAFAAQCEHCGSSNLTHLGAGSWCHWDCADCGGRTSRSHNPNSSTSGLVPDSCSGRCTWCGSAAVWSSHTFTTWTPGPDVTCTQGGTEYSHCANAQCSATTSRPGGPLGHSYVDTVIQPTCETKGCVRHTCSRCGDSYDDAEKSPLSHTYGAWVRNSDGTHTAACTRPQCYNSITAPCSSATVTAGGYTMTLCPICGHVTSNEASADLEPGKSTSVKALDGARLPGRLMVLVDAAPLEIPLKTDAFYMFVTAYQFSGKTVEYAGPVQITIDLNEHPFSMPGSIFDAFSPSMLMPLAFKLVRVEQESLNGQPAEVWHELPFTLNDGILTFETNKTGTFLLVLNISDAPSVG